MTRDMDLIRELLLLLEAYPLELGDTAMIGLDAFEAALPSYSAAQIDYNLSQIRDAGFIYDVDGPSLGIGFRGLTWAGHDFLDSIRDPAIWGRAKEGAGAAGGFTVDLLKDLAKGLVKKQIEDYTGVKL